MTDDTQIPGLVGDPGRIRMIDAQTTVDGRRIRYSISDNEDAGLWALNVHGYFAGGGVYWRESTRLAAKLGVRVVNPNLPGFAGSQPLPWEKLSMGSFAATLAGLMDNLGIDRAILLGHSMGGAVVVQFAHDYPERTLGVVYRDGIATSSWKERRGLLARALAPVSPDLGMALDVVASALVDVPDLAWSRLTSMISTAAPDIGANARRLRNTLPVAAMLFMTDITDLAVELGRRASVPLLPMWGRFDRLVPTRTAHEFAEATGTQIHWVWGGHSWMVPRPATTVHQLRWTDTGREFLGVIGRQVGVDFDLAETG